MKPKYQEGRSRLAAVSPLAAQLLRDAVRRARASIDGALSPQESQLLSDLADGRGATMLFGALTVLSRCEYEADALAVVEALRRYVMSTRYATPRLESPRDLIREETRCNYLANDAENEFLASQSPATRDRLIETHIHQMSASRRIVDALGATA